MKNREAIKQLCDSNNEILETGEDIDLIKKANLDSYRFSISWARIIPSLEPFVTLFHWDIPQGLEKEYGGFLSTKVV
ncbi:hypothetical protein LguiB_032283 [Lonicera macranthoides]